MLGSWQHDSGDNYLDMRDPRRPGDLAAVYATPTLAARLFGWKAERDLATTYQDHWRWQKNNPKGYSHA